MSKLTLKYLFVATLLDGTVIKQGRDDKCKTDPKRSAFWPLIKKDQLGNGVTDETGRLVCRPDVKTFMLVGPKQKFLVNLIDGHFEVDGRRVGTIDGKPMVQPPPLVPLELVYFRRRREHFNQGGNPIASECEYHLGWKAPTGHSQTLVLD